MRRIETSTLSNQSLASALNTHTYTADADRLIFVRVFADQLAGAGDYVAYLTIQRLGAGSAYRVVPITMAAVASGVTAAMLTTIGVPVKSTDVVKVYLTGLAGDTTTPDVTTEIWEDDGLRPATVDRQIAVDGSGRVDVSLIEGADATDTLGALDDAVLAAIAALNNLSQANVRAALGLATANLDTQLDALPTNTELATALAAADDDVLAAVAAAQSALAGAITALENLSQAQAQAAAAAALTAYDPPTQAEMDARTLPALDYATATGVDAAEAAVLAAIAALDDLSASDVEAAVAAAIAAAIIEGSLTLPEALRVCLAFASGTTEGANELLLKYKSLDGTKDRIAMTVDVSGERAAVVLDVTP